MTKPSGSQILELLNDYPVAVSPVKTTTARCQGDHLNQYSTPSNKAQVNQVDQSKNDISDCLRENNSNRYCKTGKFVNHQSFDKFPDYSIENEVLPGQKSNENSHSRRKFTPEEDHRLKQLIAKYGPKKWDKIALSMPGRTGRQCRDRFANYLNPSLVNGPWTLDEDLLLEQKVYELGQHWNVIAQFFKGRSANNIKNRWYTYLSGQKKFKSGISSKKNKNKNNSKYINKLTEPDNYTNCQYIQIDDPISNNYENNIEIIYPNIAVTSDNCYLPTNASNYIENNQSINLISKSESEKRILFPPIYPPEDSFIFTLENGILNPQFVM